MYRTCSIDTIHSVLYYSSRCSEGLHFSAFIHLPVKHMDLFIVFNVVFSFRGALIKRKLKKIEPFRPIEFARWAQQSFINVNNAIQR